LGTCLIICTVYLYAFTFPMPRPLPEVDWPAFSRGQTAKGLAAVALLLVLFFTPIPREISAFSNFVKRV
jgi:hypothetical protein